MRELTFDEIGLVCGASSRPTPATIITSAIAPLKTAKKNVKSTSGSGGGGGGGGS